ncbi:HET domain protein [Aspergillus clavatus NRRL 1]|uniref:HET domain protein n=1 Tax=Aspergillus clavatus (strain ATCC 1007 / CBS 513.65 / DSM 816 / NCTC 3887 / NRRL 1 / QM 1276 / 107) TaxID=344612 RepID=A1C6V5_ASPCL|nr:HET domain protein [Aspergillus clavatus NRRL 1]EAW14126.1 HET domain protein [Aspergillus clavatus NRRL 1]
MRLFNCSTLKLTEFLGEDVPPYAVLSHRWQDEEVTFQDIQSGISQGKKGYEKVLACCTQAQRGGLDYVWVDTFCIDKTSSAELSESLNSMYDWYHKAQVCYAFLCDVFETSVTDEGSFKDSVWFTRGWTLQELLAPTQVEFFSAEWHSLGTKSDLKEIIGKITGIQQEVLDGRIRPQELSVSQRMSWAADRVTTRIEDIAYSLLGLFEINMPMLYGEGKRAYIRLQEEIMKQSDDQTLFAWKSSDESYRGLLAQSPADFRGCGTFVQSKHKLNRTPYSVTNMGITIELAVVQWSMDIYLAALDCEIGDSQERLAIFLAPLPDNNQYARVMCEGEDLPVFPSNLESEYRKVYVRQRIAGAQRPPERMYGFWLRQFPPVHPGPNSRFEVTAYHPWDETERKLRIPPGKRGTAGLIRYSMRQDFVVNLRVGFDRLLNPVVQFGGALWSAQRGARVRDPNSFEALMDDEWMDARRERVFIGDRNHGLNLNDSTIRILIMEEVVKGQRMWVVHIAKPEDGAWHKDCVCDGCRLTVFGARYRCKTCPGFDYCSDCIKSAETTHAGHEFDEDRPAWHAGVYCDNCGEGIYGSRYKCHDCGDYDLCCYCKPASEQIHPKHRYKEIKSPDN